MFVLILFFFFNDTATTEIYPLSLHDALPISPAAAIPAAKPCRYSFCCGENGAMGGFGAFIERPSRHRVRLLRHRGRFEDRKSTRLNSSHLVISYAVFCLKKNTRRVPSYPSVF